MEFSRVFERKALAFAAMCGLGAMALTGCAADPEIEKGKPATVVSHEHHDAYTQWILAGKVLVPIYHPEEFDLNLRQCDRVSDEGTDAEGCVEAQVAVEEDVYNTHPDGSTYTVPQ